MNPQICICCGEAFSADHTADSQNPNVCAVCIAVVADEQDNLILESAIPHDLKPSTQSVDADESSSVEEEAPSKRSGSSSSQ